MVPHNCLYFQFQGIQHPLLVSMSTVHMCTDVYAAKMTKHIKQQKTDISVILFLKKWALFGDSLVMYQRLKLRGVFLLLLLPPKPML